MSRLCTRWLWVIHGFVGWCGCTRKHTHPDTELPTQSAKAKAYRAYSTDEWNPADQGQARDRPNGPFTNRRPSRHG
eukprot:1281216-Prymnesium_polylepis.1